MQSQPLRLLVGVLLACAAASGIPAASSQAPLVPAEDTVRLYRAPEVVVTGSRNPSVADYTPVRVEVFPRPAGAVEALTVAEVLEESAGVLQQYRVRSGIQLMGLEPAYTLVLLNGQPLTGRVAGVLDLRRIPLGNVERIEIVKGPMSSLYGSAALGGVVNILTPRPHNGWEGQLQLQHTTRAGSELHARLGYGNHQLSGLLYGFVHHADPFEVVQDTLSFPYAGIMASALQASAWWHPLPLWELRLDGRLFQSRTRGAFAESFGGQLAVNEGAFQQREWSAAATLAWTSRRARLQVGAFGNQYQELYDWVVPQNGSTRDDFRQRLGRFWAQYDLLWNIRYRFTAGAELLLEDVLGTRYPEQPFVRTVAAFTQWEGTPYEWLSYALSLRWDGTSAYGGHWNPKAAFLLRPWGNRAVQFRFSFGTGFRAPDFRQLFVRFTNRLQGAGYALLGARQLGLELEPERSRAGDASVLLLLDDCLRLAPWAREWTLEVRLFANWVRNLIEPFYVGRQDGLDIYSYRNLARIATRGVEVTLRGIVELPGRWQLQARAAYQFLDAVDLDVLDAIAAGTAGTQDPTTGRFQPLRRSDYGGLWGRSRHSLAGLLQLHYLPTGTALSLRLQHRSRFGDEALDRNGIAVLSPPRRVLDRPEEYVAGFWNLSGWLVQQWRFPPTVLWLSVGVRNALNVLRPRFLPHLVGRQWFITGTLQWSTTAR
ncbi:Colicin I receptor [bacterium HR21]|nr:Colicin I receptor [bacterium HR21]